MQRLPHGYSLVELVAILVVVSVLGVSAVGRLSDGNSEQVRSSRDSVVATLSAAQQLAMVTTAPVRVVIDGHKIDIQQKDAEWTSVNAGGVQYPLVLSPVEIEGPQTFISFNRLGKTEPVVLRLKRGANSATVSVETGGFSQ